MNEYDRFLARRYLLGALKRALEERSLRPGLIGWIATDQNELRGKSMPDSSLPDSTSDSTRPKGRKLPSGASTPIFVGSPWSPGRSRGRLPAGR